MAIAYGGISAVSTTSTFTSVAVSGSDTIGFVFVAGDSAADNITAITWGGVSMTKITAVQVPTDRYISAWWVAAPSSSASIVATGGSFWRACSAYYTGAKQTAQVDSSNTGTSSSSAVITVATTVVASNSWYVMFQKDITGGRIYTSSGVLATTRLDNDAGGLGVADSAGTVGTGSQSGTMTQTSGTSSHGAIAFSIAPVAAAPTVNGNFLAFM